MVNKSGHGFFGDTPSLFETMGLELAAEIQGDVVDYSGYINDAIGFQRDILGVQHLWSKLEEVSLSVQNNQYTAVQSANSVGKTYTAARVGIWWFNVFREQCKILTTAAPPERQIKELLWGEIKAAIRQAEQRGVALVGGRPGAMSIRVHDSWWMQGFTIPITGTREERIARFQGHHSPNLLIIVDEAHGVPPEIFEAIDACMSGGHNHLLLLSNPLSQSGPFHDAVNDPKFNVIKISAFDHPNVQTGEEVIPGAITREKTEERIRNWSEPLYADQEADANCFTVPVNFSPDIAGQVRRIVMPFLATKTLGTFPEYSENSVIPTYLIQMAVERWKSKPPNIESVTDAEIVGGLDVAELGPDSNAWITRQGSWVSPVEKWNGVDPSSTGAKASIKAKEMNTSIVYVDANSVGAGVPKVMTFNGVVAHGVKFSQRPTIDTIITVGDTEVKYEFQRIRDQLYWSIREWLRTDPEAMLPPDKMLTQELSVLTYDIMINGKITVIQKKHIRKRIGRSPDSLDALALTFYRGKPWKALKMVRV